MITSVEGGEFYVQSNVEFRLYSVCGKMGQQRNDMSSNMILILSLDILHLIQSDALITEV